VVDLGQELWQAVRMTKNRKKTYSDHQAEAARLKKQAELLKKPPKSKPSQEQGK